ncbi:MAG: proton-conducting transporter membrane subunit [Halobellus sp.]|uniref:proton-conducting transporter transmembrane domain-containing protein n=1 Tax=Halobellus sp. TaxID=1979212 RepID=UPI0035D517AE
MTDETQSTTVGAEPSEAADATPFAPAVLTRLVWALWVASVGVLGMRFLSGSTAPWQAFGAVTVDGLTVLLWIVVTFFSGIIHSYSCRYMAGDSGLTRFFTRIFGFTVAVMVLAAADHAALFVGAWLAMGLVMADLVGHVRGWSQAQAAAGLARRYFVGSSALVGTALAVLWWQTGATTVSGIAAATSSLSGPSVFLAGSALVLAAAIQSALLPFHTWLLSSMTAPTPASALMHAGFVNAGGILLLRFAPVVTIEPSVMLAIVLLGTISALGGKLLKSVQTDVKRRLGCSTVGQMGFMLMQAGLGFFGAAITHLVLHGFYKAYKFLSAGSRVERAAPSAAAERDSLGLVGVAVAAVSAVAGGAVFVVTTGKGGEFDTGLLLTLIVVVSTMHAARTTLGQGDLPVAARLAAIPLVLLPAVALYGLVYNAIRTVLSGLPIVTAATTLTPVHGLVAVAFVSSYVAIDTGVYRRSRRLYVALLNASRSPTTTMTTSTEDYNEY